MHAGIANQRFPLKSVAGKTLPALPAHAPPTVLYIPEKAHAFDDIDMDQIDQMHVGVGNQGPAYDIWMMIY